MMMKQFRLLLRLYRKGGVLVKNITQLVMTGAVLVGLMTGCGAAVSKTSGPVTVAPKSDDSGQQGITAGRLSSKLTESDAAGGKVIFEFTMMNQKEVPVKLTYRSTQKYDYIITDASGHTIEKYSKGKMFGMVVTSITLKQGEKATYTATSTPLKAGSYQVDFWSVATGEDVPKLENKLDFTVKGDANGSDANSGSGSNFNPGTDSNPANVSPPGKDKGGSVSSADLLSRRIKLANADESAADGCHDGAAVYFIS